MAHITELNSPKYKKTREVINSVFEVNVLDKSRERTFVNARMVYSKILRDEKTSFKNIAKSLLKNHASIIYYVKTIDCLLSYDKDLLKKYKHCLTLLGDDGERELTLELSQLSKNELILLIKKLKKQNNLLSLSTNV